VVETTAVTAFAVGVRVTMAVAVARALVAVRVCVFVTVVLHINTVFAGVQPRRRVDVTSGKSWGTGNADGGRLCKDCGSR
jgi:hypothetical protein